MSTSPRFVIYGAGAIGATLGAALHLSGTAVTLVARGAHYDALRVGGLEFEHAGEQVNLEIPVVDHPADIDFEPGDVVVLAMKGQDTPAALTVLGRYTPPSISIVCAQNGVENERVALRYFGDVHGMCVICPATHLAPGRVTAHLSPIFGAFDLGRYPGGADDVDTSVAAALSSASCESVVRSDIMAWKYAKLLGNLGNAPSALFVEGDGRRAIVERARAEALACFAAAGFGVVDPKAFEERARPVRDQPDPRPTGSATDRVGSSTWQSLARSVGSVETDFLNGEIALLGRLHGVATPVNELLQRMMSEAVRDRQAPETLEPYLFDQRLANAI